MKPSREGFIVIYFERIAGRLVGGMVMQSGLRYRLDVAKSPGKLLFMDIINRHNTEPFITKDGSTIRELLAHRNSCISKQSLAEAIVPPGRRTEPHYHVLSEEIYYILQGSGIMYLREEQQSVAVGDAIAIPPGEKHSILNNGTSDLVFLCCCAPAYEHSDTVLCPENQSTRG